MRIFKFLLDNIFSVAQIKGFSFYHYNNYLIVNTVFPILALIDGYLVIFSKLSYRGMRFPLGNDRGLTLDLLKAAFSEELWAV